MNEIECETCIKRKTKYCPNSSECSENIDKPYYQNRIMLLEENQQLKEEKRLILKDISFWIRNSKVEQIEGDKVHQRYWMYFEDIVNKIFKKYNTENLSDEDLKYNHYLDKENEELIRQLQQKEDIINKIREYLTSYESISEIEGLNNVKENKKLDEKTMNEMIRRYINVHDKILEILDNKGE